MDIDLISLNGKVSDNKVISYIKRTDLHVSQLFAYLLCCLKERKNPNSKYNTPRYLSISNKSCFKDTHYNLLHIQRDGIFIKYLTCNSFLFWNAKIIHFLQNKLNYLTMGWSIYNFPSEKYLKYPNICLPFPLGFRPSLVLSPDGKLPALSGPSVEGPDPPLN